MHRVFVYLTFYLLDRLPCILLTKPGIENLGCGVGPVSAAAAAYPANGPPRWRASARLVPIM